MEDKLTILWTNADILTSEHMVFMYAKASLSHGFWKKVEIIIWGATAKLVAENLDIQKKLLEVESCGVKVRGCIACAKALDVEDTLRGIGLELLPMGQPLTDILKTDGKLITI